MRIKHGFLRLSAFCLTLVSFAAGSVAAGPDNPPEYQNDVAPIFTKYCAGCHNADEANGELNFDSFATLMKGGVSGPAVVPGDAESSRLILLIEMRDEPNMPPEGNPGPSAEQIALLKRWIDAGANAPKVADTQPALPATPKIAIAGEVRRPIYALSFSPDGRFVAVARHERVEILSADSMQLQRVLVGHHGQVNDVRFSKDGSLLAVAAGGPGLFGEATLWQTAGWRETGTFRGHGDSLYAAAPSPDGRYLATGSYDQKVKLWDVDGHRELRQLDGHNGAVFDLAFHPSGQILATASDDETVKIWNVETGERLDTFNEPTEAQYAVEFSPDGRYVVAGGVDNRIRVWEITETGREGTNPIRYSRFAHDAAILRLRFSPDGRWLISSAEDRALKVWETESFTQQRAFETQPDWVTALAVSPDNSTLLAGRLDGSRSAYSLNDEPEKAAARPDPITHVSTPQPHAASPASKEPTEVAEAEPNDSPEQAMRLAPPVAVRSVLFSKNGPPDADLFRFEAKEGQTWIIETRAAQDESPADTKIEVLHPDGSPVPRLLLRAVRDSEITFRPIDSTQAQARLTNWEEMELNQFLYMNGEVAKLFRAPRGPDSGFDFYAANNGQRRCYFDTSATVHPNHEPVYIVEPYPPGTQLADNGLPAFPLYYANDDDGERKLGSDSQLTFRAPRDGSYLVRVTDVPGLGGEDFRYELIVREPQPDFRVTLAGKDAKIGAGSGQRLTIKLERIDNFNREVQIEVSGLPDGFLVLTPTVIQADHLQAEAVINVEPHIAPDAVETDDGKGHAANEDVAEPSVASNRDWSHVKVTATAVINGEAVTKDVGDLGKLRVTEKPKVLVHLRPEHAETSDQPITEPPELVIAPGTTITAMLSIERNGFDGELKFEVDNLPHGVIVDNIGLNGVLIREGETKRQIFITAAEWVPESSRWIHAVALGAGNQASWPVMLYVRKPGQMAQAVTPVSETAP